MTNDGNLRGLTAAEIRELAKEFIRQGGKIKCAPENRADYKDRRYFHYDIIIKDFPDDFPYGLYVEMELFDPNEDEPVVNILNAHPQRGF